MKIDAFELEAVRSPRPGTEADERYVRAPATGYQQLVRDGAY